MTSLLLAADATGAGDGEHAHGHATHTELMPLTSKPGQSALPALTAIIVFGLLLVVLWRTVWPKITSGLDDREKKIRNEILAAEQARKQAEASQAEFERKLNEGRQEAVAMIAKAKQDAQAAADELRARNEAELADLRQRAQRDLASATQAAIAQLHTEAAQLATLMAGKILKREITVSDQQRLMEDSVRELQASRN